MLKYILSKFVSRLWKKSSTKVTVIKKQEIKENARFQFIQSWKSFFDYSTINGLYIIYGSHTYHKTARIAIVLFLMLISACCVYQCSNFIVTYLDVPLKTSFVYNRVKEITFPAITFCHTTFSKKSALAPFVSDDDSKPLLEVVLSSMGKNYAEIKLLEATVRIEKYAHLLCSL